VDNNPAYNPKLKPTKHRMAVILVNGHKAITLIDQQTTDADLISTKFCTLHNILMLKLTKPVVINIVMKGSQGKCHNYVRVKINYRQYVKYRTFWVANLSDWDIILRYPALIANQAIVDIGNNIRTIKDKDG